MNAAIITARAGSKSIPDKNVFPVDGKPLVSYPAEAALAAERIDGVYVSTDGDSIAEACSRLGVDVIERPEALAGDAVNHGDVIKHAVEWVDQRRPDLENTQPWLSAGTHGRRGRSGPDRRPRAGGRYAWNCRFARRATGCSSPAR